MPIWCLETAAILIRETEGGTRFDYTGPSSKASEASTFWLLVKKILTVFSCNTLETLTQRLSNAQKQRPTIIKICPELKSVIRHKTSLV